MIPWQGALGSTPLLRVAVAVGLFCAPGFALRSAGRDGGGSLVGCFLFGFAASVMAVGVAGLGGSLLALPAPWSRVALAAAGMVGLAVGIGRRTPRGRQPIGRDDVWTIVVVGATLVLGARLAFAPYIGGDDITHVARIAVFQQQDQLGYSALALGGENVLPPRYWLAFWPYWQALLATIADVHPLELTANELSPIVAAIALLAVYDLARALGMSQRRAALATVAQLALLVCLSSRTQPGWLFFDRVTEDKFLAFFVIAPIAFACLTRAIAAPRDAGALRRLAGTWLALVFTHPTSLGMSFLVGAAYCALDVAFGASRRRALACLATLVAITAGAATVRLVPHPFYEKLERGPAARFQAVSGDGERRGRINLVSGTPFFGVGTEAAPPAWQLVGGLVLVFAVARAKCDPTARFLAASLGVVALAVVPYTGWLVGKVLPPFHLWRILCLVPFGIGATFVATLVSRGFVSAGTRARHTIDIAAVCGPALLLLGVAAATLGFRMVDMTSLSPPRGWRESVVLVRFDHRKRTRVPYDDIVTIADRMRQSVPPGSVVLGDGRTNNLIPSMSARVAVVCFRSVHQTMLHANLTRERARDRCNGLKRLIAGRMSADEALDFLAEHQVGFAVTESKSEWLDELPINRLPRRLVAETGTLRLYALGAHAAAAAPTSDS